ncbi:MAG: nitrogen system component [Candidatus Binatota bacterium]|jgi:PTS system nitrogen regulatory IIA component|nr:nitrogen system component [Candidatus Binatota bacterium]
MKILDILPAENVVPDLHGSTKAEVLGELAAAVCRRRADIDKERLVEVLLDREKLGSTAIGEGIAIPHGKLMALDNVLAAFGRSSRGVDFSSLDGGPTRLFFLLIAPEDSSGAHLKALARVSRLLRNKDFREKLLELNTREDLYAAIREEDEKY